MKNLVTLLLASVFVVMGAGALSVFNAAPTATIKVEGISPLEAEVLGLSFETSGLATVGKGEIVYLMGGEAAGEAVTAYAWTLTGPAGSTATLDSTGTKGNTFRPDMAGTFTVTLNVTTASGSSAAPATMTITAAQYVGVGSIAGATPNTMAGQCGTCHSGVTAGWAGTDHATFFQNAIDGKASAHYNAGCVKCHVAGYNTDPEAENGGFDDVAAALGWTFPETLQDGNWADIVANYPELAQRSNIQCENCHGPGSQHFGSKARIGMSLDEAVCGTCHEDGHYHVRSIQWKGSGHAVGIASASTRSGCADCHSGWGFIAKVDPASNHDLKTGFAQTSCAVCHDPHSTQFPDQLRRVENATLPNGVVVTWGGNGRLCMNCHMGRRDAESYAVPANASTHFGPHYSNQTDMLAGTNAITFGRRLPNSIHSSALKDGCVNCHMYVPKEGEPGYKAVATGHAEDRMSPLGEHSWRMAVEIDGEHIENTGACVTCHGELDSFESLMSAEDMDGDGTKESTVDEIKGLLDEVGKLLPPLGEPGVVTTKDFTPLQMKAAFNWKFVHEDGSHGLHNYQFAANLLKLTRQVLLFGVLTENNIEQIVDVPNDQGKQVMVSWTRFGGDGPSDDPLQTYYVWRQVDEADKAPFSGRVFQSLADVPTDPAKLGEARVMAEGALWTAVGSQPAAHLDSYVAVVPTLYDVVGTDTTWSWFMVSGHTKVPQNYVTSQAARGYSVDNLAPSAPSNVMASTDGVVVSLAWDAALESDLKYYEVYRGDEMGFEPAVAVGTTAEPVFVDHTVASGMTYYYRVVAYDFALNRGSFSQEVSSLVMVAVEGDGVPTEFTLRQNYPNPFNPQTKISFSVPEAAHVKISIVDMNGKQVAVLVDAMRQPGTYSLTWDAGSLASGVYIYRMEAGKFAQARPMTLLR